MNWIGNHPMAGHGDSINDPGDDGLGKPVTPLIISDEILISQPDGWPDGWIGAGVEMYKLRQELLGDLFQLFASRLKRVFD